MSNREIVPNLQKKLGKRIRQLRKDRGYSQESFAFECGLHRTYVGCIERGEKNITVANVEKVAKALKITMEELFKDYDNT